jgi:hypothetical protein
MESCDTLLIIGDKVNLRLPLNKVFDSAVHNIWVAVEGLYKAVSVAKETKPMKHLHLKSALKQNGTPQPAKS